MYPLVPQRSRILIGARGCGCWLSYAPETPPKLALSFHPSPGTASFALSFRPAAHAAVCAVRLTSPRLASCLGHPEPSPQSRGKGGGTPKRRRRLTPSAKAHFEFSRVGSFPQSKFWSLVSELSQSRLFAHYGIVLGLPVIRKFGNGVSHNVSFESVGELLGHGPLGARKTIRINIASCGYNQFRHDSQLISKGEYRVDTRSLKSLILLNGRAVINRVGFCSVSSPRSSPRKE
jgi:hypothetical protein